MKHEDKLARLALRVERAEWLCQRQEEKLHTLYILLLAIDAAVRTSDSEAVALTTRAVNAVRDYVNPGKPTPFANAPLRLVPDSVVRLPQK